MLLLLCFAAAVAVSAGVVVAGAAFVDEDAKGRLGFGPIWIRSDQFETVILDPNRPVFGVGLWIRSDPFRPIWTNLDQFETVILAPLYTYYNRPSSSSRQQR